LSVQYSGQYSKKKWTETIIKKVGASGIQTDAMQRRIKMVFRKRGHVSSIYWASLQKSESM